MMTALTESIRNASAGVRISTDLFNHKVVEQSNEKYNTNIIPIWVHYVNLKNGPRVAIVRNVTEHSIAK